MLNHLRKVGKSKLREKFFKLKKNQSMPSIVTAESLKTNQRIEEEAKEAVEQVSVKMKGSSDKI